MAARTIFLSTPTRVRDSYRQQRQRRRRHHVSVPLQEQPGRHYVADRCKNISIPLVQAGTISASSDAALNLKETYQVDIVRGDRRTGTRQAVLSSSGARDLVKPFDFIGTKTFGSVAAYEAYAAQSIHTINIPGCANPVRCLSANAKTRL